MNARRNATYPESSDAADQALLARVAAGDRAALETLYRDYQLRLARFLSRVTRRPELVEEAINDTFWIVWRKAGSFRGDSRTSTWIMGIAYRCALKALGAAGGEAVELRESEDALDESVAEQELRDWVLHALRLLPVDQRSTIQLAYYHGHSCEEIAEIMGCATGTVKARLFHARVRLRSLLPALGGTEDVRHESKR